MPGRAKEAEKRGEATARDLGNRGEAAARDLGDKFDRTVSAVSQSVATSC